MDSNLMPLFVYGTLRPGQKLSRLIEDATAFSIPARAIGNLYHVPYGTDEKPVYPVAFFGEEGWIYGDILFVDPDSEEFRYVHHMETSSGYRAEEVLVLADNGYPYQATAYEYTLARGALIESGNWCE